MKNIMVVDDEKSICNALRFALKNDYNVFMANNLMEFDKIIFENKLDIILLDLKFGTINGIDLLERVKITNHEIVVIMMTAYGTIETSIKAIKNGAFDYILKPIDLDNVRKIIKDACDFQDNNRKIDMYNSFKEFDNVNIIGKSSKILDVIELIHKVKDLDVNILIIGDSGTGKELVAKAIHSSGNRKNMPFRVLNCGAIPQNLIESEFFGYEKGAFTGADKSKKGAFESANKGCIFLDEIGEMDLFCQVKLLRAIQNKEVTPLGSNETKKIDVKVIAATNKDLQAEVEAGRFRSDLFYRLNVMPIYIPSLNERPEDIQLLVEYFIKKANDMYNINIKGITRQALDKLEKRKYDGNIRELENIIYRASILCKDEYIDEDVIQDSKYDEKYNNYMRDFIAVKVGTKLEDMEKEMILRTLDYVNGNKMQTSKLLGISLRSLHYKLKNYAN